MKSRGIDQKIIELLSQKAESSIKKLRGTGGASAYQAEDAAALQGIIEAHNKGPLPNEFFSRVYTELLSASMMAVIPVKVAYLGPKGTFTYIALCELFGESADAVPQRSISEVFREVETGGAQYGVVPVENSTEGAVTFTLDELIETDLNIISEKYIRISYSLLSKCKDIAGVKKIFSHPQPAGQCKGWLRLNMPNVEIITVDSTTYAAELALQEDGSAAIASVLAAEIYGLTVLVNRMEDSRQNFTRFFVIGRHMNRPTGNDKTSVVCAVKDKPGALLRLLQPFSNAGINMTKIESRPDKKKIWAYNFFIDFNGHKDEKIIVEALEKVREESIFLKILGSYPVGT